MDASKFTQKAQQALEFAARTLGRCGVAPRRANIQVREKQVGRQEAGKPADTTGYR